MKRLTWDLTALSDALVEAAAPLVAEVADDVMRLSSISVEYREFPEGVPKKPTDPEGVAAEITVKPPKPYVNKSFPRKVRSAGSPNTLKVTVKQGSKFTTEPVLVVSDHPLSPRVVKRPMRAAMIYASNTRSGVRRDAAEEGVTP